MDKLDTIFEKQRVLAQNFIPLGRLFASQEFDAERQQYIASYIQLLQEEAVELLRECPARKFWRKSVQVKPVNVSALKEELVDVMHIVVAISLICGVSAEELYELYVTKNEINLARVANNS